MSTSIINGSIDADGFYELVQLFRAWGELPNSRDAVQLQDLVLPADRARLDEAIARGERPEGIYYVAGELRDLDFIDQVVMENVEHLLESGDTAYANTLMIAVDQLRRNCREVIA